MIGVVRARSGSSAARLVLGHPPAGSLGCVVGGGRRLHASVTAASLPRSPLRRRRRRWRLCPAAPPAARLRLRAVPARMRAKSSSTEGPGPPRRSRSPRRDRRRRGWARSAAPRRCRRRRSSWSWGSSAVPRRNWSAHTLRRGPGLLVGPVQLGQNAVDPLTHPVHRRCHLVPGRPELLDLYPETAPPCRQVGQHPRRASWTWSRSARPSSLARVMIASPAAIASAMIRSLSTRASCSAFATSSSTSPTRSAAAVSVRACSSSTWRCVSRSSVAAPSWACTTIRAASSWAWRRIWALCCRARRSASPRRPPGGRPAPRPRPGRSATPPRAPRGLRGCGRPTADRNGPRRCRNPGGRRRRCAARCRRLRSGTMRWVASFCHAQSLRRRLHGHRLGRHLSPRRFRIRSTWSRLLTA